MTVAEVAEGEEEGEAPTTRSDEELPAGVLRLRDEELLAWQLSFDFVECLYHNAQHFRRAHWNATNERLTRPMKTRLREGLMSQMRRYDSLRLPAFAVAGSLLGWARECDVLSYADIPGNTDVDFAVFARDSGGPDVIKRIARTAKIPPTISRAYGNFSSEVYEVRWSFRLTPPEPLYKAVAFDLFFLFANHGPPDPPNSAHYSILYTGEKRWWGNINVPIIPKTAICSSELNGVLIRVPCDPEPFLEAGYGELWMEPKQRWSYGGGRKVNFRKAGKWTKEEDKYMIQTKFTP